MEGLKLIHVTYFGTVWHPRGQSVLQAGNHKSKRFHKAELVCNLDPAQFFNYPWDSSAVMLYCPTTMTIYPYMPYVLTCGVPFRAEEQKLDAEEVRPSPLEQRVPFRR
jgi:hypothetical protein